jgi:plastocyanin
MPRPLALALVAVLGVTATGCADDAPPVRARNGAVAITLDDYLIRPQTVRAKAGRITFRVTNRGKIGHTFHVFLGQRDALGIRTILPGHSATGSAEFKRGTYKMVCVLGNHEELGMYGTLVVR